MNVSKLPIMIADPAAQVERNFNKYVQEFKEWAGFRHYMESTGCLEIMRLRHLNSENGLGIVLLEIKKTPNIDDFSINADLQYKKVYNVGECLTFACITELITSKKSEPTRWSLYSKPSIRYHITDLGEALLKQNRLID